MPVLYVIAFIHTHSPLWTVLFSFGSIANLGPRSRSQSRGPPAHINHAYRQLHVLYTITPIYIHIHIRV